MSSKPEIGSLWVSPSRHSCCTNAATIEYDEGYSSEDPRASKSNIEAASTLRRHYAWRASSILRTITQCNPALQQTTGNFTDTQSSQDSSLPWQKPGPSSQDYHGLSFFINWLNDFLALFVFLMNHERQSLHVAIVVKSFNKSMAGSGIVDAPGRAFLSRGQSESQPFLLCHTSLTIKPCLAFLVWPIWRAEYVYSRPYWTK